MAKRHPLPANPIPSPTAAQRVTFEPIEGVEAHFDRLLQCRDGLDFMWSDWSLFRMARRGVVETVPIKLASNERIDRVVWDGEYVWVSTLKPQMLIYSRDGRLLGQVPPEEIPAAEKPTVEDLLRERRLQDKATPALKKAMLKVLEEAPPMRLHALTAYPIEPGKCLVIGQIDHVGRSWLAIASKSGTGDGSFGLKVFHTARKIADRGTKTDDTETVFFAGGVLEPAGLKKGRRVVIVPRGSFSGFSKPLAIDLATLEVSVYPAAALPLLQGGVTVGSQVLTFSRGQIGLVSPGADPAQPWTMRTLNAPVPDENPYRMLPMVMMRYGLGSAFLKHGDFVYVPGGYWHRVNTRTLAYELLNKQPLPATNWYGSFAVSAHYGLIGWNGDCRQPGTGSGPTPPGSSRGVINRVFIDRPEPGSIDTDYAFVPREQRGQHAAAVQFIREHGGSVGQVNDITSREVPMTVYLPRAWTGGDDGLRRLRDVFQLKRLFLIQAPITNAGMVHLAGLADLERLSLVETKVTDDGLAPLASCPRLYFVRLEGTLGGNEFTDRGLAQLRDEAKPKVPTMIRGLALYGKGFTDAAVPELKRQGILELILLDTAISDAGVAELRPRAFKVTRNLESVFGLLDH